MNLTIHRTLQMYQADCQDHNQLGLSVVQIHHLTMVHHLYCPQLILHLFQPFLQHLGKFLRFLSYKLSFLGLSSFLVLITFSVQIINLIQGLQQLISQLELSLIFYFLELQPLLLQVLLMYQIQQMLENVQLRYKNSFQLMLLLLELLSVKPLYQSFIVLTCLQYFFTF